MKSRIIAPLARRAGKSRLVVFMCIVTFLSFAAFAAYQAFVRENDIKYRERHPPATPAEACPGDTITYPVKISVTAPDTVTQINEGWCVYDSICPAAWQETARHSQVVDPLSRSIEIPNVPRKIPDGLPAGKWEYRHCNTTLGSGGKTGCYGVVVTVLPPDQCPKKETTDANP